jgi:anti-sigma B factor antagonist
VKNVEVSYCETDIAIVKLFEEHDMADSEELSRVLHRVLGARDLLIVDLSEAAFIDSSILNSLIAANKTADRAGLKMTIQLGPKAIVARLLEVSGLNGFLTCANSREEAITLARNGSEVAA